MRAITLVIFGALLFTPDNVEAQDRSNLTVWEQQVENLEVSKSAACLKLEQLRAKYHDLKSNGASAEELGQFRRTNIAEMRQCKAIEEELAEAQSNLLISARNYIEDALLKKKLDLIVDDFEYLEGSEYLQNYSYIYAFRHKHGPLLSALVGARYRPIAYCINLIKSGGEVDCYIKKWMNFYYFEDDFGYWNQGLEIFSGYGRRNFRNDYLQFEVAKTDIEKEDGKFAIPPKILGLNLEETIAFNKCRVDVLQRLGRADEYRVFLREKSPTSVEGYIASQYEEAIRQDEIWSERFADYIFDGVYRTKYVKAHAQDEVANYFVQSAKDEAAGNVIYPDASARDAINSTCG